MKYPGVEFDKRASAWLAAVLVLWLPPSLAAEPVLQDARRQSEFYAWLAITSQKGEQAQFIAGDNVSGYYEGFTYAYQRGQGYQFRNGNFLHDFASSVGGQLLDRRRDALTARILPHGSQTDFPAASEALLLHQGQQAISLRVAVQQADKLAILPLWTLKQSEWEVQQYANVLVLRTRGETVAANAPVIAISSDVGFRLQAGAGDEFSFRQLQAGNADRLITAIESAQPVRQLTVHVVFDRSLEQATRRARTLAATDSWAAALTARYQQLIASPFITSDDLYNRALVWAKASAQSFVVEEFGKGIWAGLPWFRDNWGRDTFIALPGTMLVTGQFADAKLVIDNFARLQKRGELVDREYGRIPNRVAAGDSIIYNTVDGTPWLIRELLEYARYSGDANYAQQLLPFVRDYVRGVDAHWLDTNGLLTHEDADTWMDARIAGNEAWSPRGNRAVEIQALWCTTLDVAAELAARSGNATEATAYRVRADKVRQQFLRLFWDGEQMADRLLPDDRRDLSLRPNQLMLASVPFQPFVADAVQAHIVRNAVSGLLYPYGIASLDPRHGNFHPRHENPAFHHKDAAYHNGTIWGWNAGFTVTALNKFGYQDLAWALSQNLADQILHLGTHGSMSELLDALPGEDGRVNPSGTYAQSWSVAEFVRNAYQDYLGFRPNLLDNELLFVPALSSQWTSLDTLLHYGAGESLALQLRKRERTWHWQFRPEQRRARQVVMDLLTEERSRYRVRFTIAGRPQHLSWDGQHAVLDGRPLPAEKIMDSQASTIGSLQFLQPSVYRPEAYPTLRGKDVLQRHILQDADEQRKSRSAPSVEITLESGQQP